MVAFQQAYAVGRHGAKGRSAEKETTGPHKGARGILPFTRPALNYMRQRARRMFFGVVDRVGLQHLAIGTDDHGDPRRSFLVGAVRRAIGHGDGPVGIAQQIGGQADFVAPFPQIFRRTESNAQDDGVFRSVVRGSITEPVRLLGSIIPEGTRVEPDQNMPTRVVRETYRRTVLVRQGKGGRDAPDFR